MNDKDLKRCKADKAKAIVLLNNKQSLDPQKEDGSIILQAILIKKYLRNFIKSDIPFCI